MLFCFSESFSNIERLFNTYGSIIRIWQSGIKLSVFVVDPNIVEYFLSSNIHIKKSAGYDLYQPWLGQGLINNTGEFNLVLRNTTRRRLMCAFLTDV